MDPQNFGGGGGAGGGSSSYFYVDLSKLLGASAPPWPLGSGGPGIQDTLVKVYSV